MSRLAFLLPWLAVFGLAACEGQQTAAPSSTAADIEQVQSKPLPLRVNEFVSADGQRLRVDGIDSDHVRLSLPGGPEQVFTAAVSASGARFLAGEWEWWEHQGEGTLRQGDAIVFQGQLQQP